MSRAKPTLTTKMFPMDAHEAETPVAKSIRQLADLRHLLLDIANGEAQYWHDEQLPRWAKGHADVVKRVIDELKLADDGSTPKPNLVAAELSTVKGTLGSLLENPTGGTRFSNVDARLVQDAIERLDVAISCLRVVRQLQRGAEGGGR